MYDIINVLTDSVDTVVVSSANKYGSPLIIDSARSRTKIENNMGPSIDPWGTPNLTVTGSDLFPETWMNC